MAHGADDLNLCCQDAALRERDKVAAVAATNRARVSHAHELEVAVAASLGA